MSNIRWKLWELASWMAYWLCPDKKALALIMQNGTIVSRAALDATRAAKEVKSEDRVEKTEKT